MKETSRSFHKMTYLTSAVETAKMLNNPKNRWDDNEEMDCLERIEEDLKKVLASIDERKKSLRMFIDGTVK